MTKAYFIFWLWEGKEPILHDIIFEKEEADTIGKNNPVPCIIVEGYAEKEFRGKHIVESFGSKPKQPAFTFGKDGNVKMNDSTP